MAKHLGQTHSAIPGLALMQQQMAARVGFLQVLEGSSVMPLRWPHLQAQSSWRRQIPCSLQWPHSCRALPVATQSQACLLPVLAHSSASSCMQILTAAVSRVSLVPACMSGDQESTMLKHQRAGQPPRAHVLTRIQGYHCIRPATRQDLQHAVPWAWALQRSSSSRVMPAVHLPASQ